MLIWKSGSYANVNTRNVENVMCKLGISKNIWKNSWKRICVIMRDGKNNVQNKC